MIGPLRNTVDQRSTPVKKVGIATGGQIALQARMVSIDDGRKHSSRNDR